MEKKASDMICAGIHNPSNPRITVGLEGREIIFWYYTNVFRVSASMFEYEIHPGKKPEPED